MASITVCGTCVPPGPSRKTTGWPLTVCERDGNWARTQAKSNRPVSSFWVATVRSSVVMSNSFLGLLRFLSREYRVPEGHGCSGNERDTNTLQNAVRRKVWDGRQDKESSANVFWVGRRATRALSLDA